MSFDVKNVLRKNTDGINDSEVELIPGMDGVLVTIYDINPYRYIEKTESGLILGIESDKRYESHETGEIEECQDGIVCGHVIATGPKVDFVEPGEDVYFMKSIANPIPFRKKGYYIINERNIICRIKEKYD